MRRAERHGAVDIVEQRGGKRPVATDGRLRTLPRQRAAGELGIAALTFAEGAVADRALVGKDVGALIDRALARRQTLPVRTHRQRPALDLLRARRHAVPEIAR